MQDLATSVNKALADTSSMKCIRFDVCKDGWNERRAGTVRSSMKCIRFDVCKQYNALNVTDIPAPQ